MHFFRRAGYIGVASVLVVTLGIITLRSRFPVGPAVVAITGIPIIGLLLAGCLTKRVIPDIIFGMIDTGLLTFFAVIGGVSFGVVGAIIGGVIGDAVTDGIAGFFEGYIARWLRSKGIDESRDPITTSLGKMAGCLLGSGVVLTIAWMAGVSIHMI